LAAVEPQEDLTGGMGFAEPSITVEYYILSIGKSQYIYLIKDNILEFI
jgi:hypothetical protein